MEKFIAGLAAVLVVIALSIGGWFLERWLNNWAYYEGATQKVICKMVKAEHLTAEGQQICRRK